MAGQKAQFDADFSRFVGELDKVETKLRKFEPNIDQSSRRLERLTNSLQGHKLQEQAGVAALAIERIGGASRLSERDLGKFGRLFDEVSAQAKRFGRDVPAAVQAARIEIDALRKPIEDTAASAQKLSRLGSIGESIAGGIGLGIGVGVLDAAAGSIRDIVSQGAKLTPISQSFERINGGADAAEEKLAGMREATRGLVGDLDLMLQANTASILGLDRMGVSAADAAKVAVTLGRAVGVDATQAIGDFNNAIGRGSSEVLNNLGIQLRASDAYEIWAGRIGKTADKLTDQEKATAFATVAMERARAKAAELGEAELTVYEQGVRVVTILGDLATGIASAGNETGGLASGLGKVAEALGRIRDNAPRALRSISAAPDDALKAALQYAPSGMLGAGPFGAAIQEYLRLRMGAPDPVDLRLLNAAGGRDIPAPFTPPKPSGGGGGNTPGAGELAKRAAELKKYREEVEKLSGQSTIAGAERLARQVREIGAARIPTTAVDGLTKSLAEALKTAKDTGRAIGTDVAGQLNALVQTPGYRALFRDSLVNPRVGAIGAPRTGDAGIFSTFGLAGAVDTSRDAYLANLIPSKNPINTAWLAPTVRGLQAAKTETRDWSKQIENVAESFARLAQISGTLSGVTEQVGKFFGALDAARNLTSGLGLSKGAQGNLSAGVGGAMLGFDLGSNFGRVGGTLAGAAGGALAGAPYAAATGGASVAIGAAAGGIAGYFGARSAESQLRKLKDLQAEQLVAQHGTLDALLGTVARLGLNQQTFLERFYGEPRDFAKGVSDLTAALTREKNEADALAKAFDRVTKARGVLNPDQLRSIAGVRAGSPGEENVRNFLSAQNEQAIGGLERFLATGPLSAAGASGGGEALGAAFEALLAYGVPADEAVRRLSTSIEGFRKNAVDAGAGSTEAFDLLQIKLRALTDESMAPFTERALGAGQALAGFANQGRVTQAIFGGLTPSIGEAYDRMEAMGQGGVEAIRLLQGPLQTAWQLNKDLGLEVDDNTRRVLDFAESSGLIGEAFRPSEDRMALGIEKLVTLFEGFLGTLDKLPTVAGRAASGMADAFSRVRVPSLDDMAPGPGSSRAADRSVAGGGVGDVYLDGERVGFQLARHQGAASEYATT